MYKVILTVGIFFSCFVSSFATEADTMSLYKKVPVVVYTPDRFYCHLMDAFNNDQTQLYLLVSKTDRTVYRYDYASIFWSGEYKPQEFYKFGGDGKIGKFKPLIMENDSVFLFAIFPSQRFDDNILGIKNGKKLTFIDSENNWYNSLEEVVLAKTNSKDLGEFFEKYIARIRAGFYEMGGHPNFQYSGFYDILTEEDAGRLLKNDPYYNQSLLKDTTAYVKRFTSILSEFVDIPSDDVDEINKKICEYLRNNEPIGLWDKTTEQTIADKGFDGFMVMDQNVYSILKEHISPDMYSELSRKYKIYRNKIFGAEKILREKHWAYMIPIMNERGTVNLGRGGWLEFIKYLNEEIFPLYD